MKINYKVIISICIILFGTVTLFFFLKNKAQKVEFNLLEQVKEADLAYNTDLIDVIDDVIQYNSEVTKSLSNKVGLHKLKDQLLNSGLKNDQIYITHSFKNQGVTSLYAEITDTAKFESLMKQLIPILELSSIKDSLGYFISESKKVSLEKHPQYVKFNFGKGAEMALTDIASPPSSFFVQQLRKSNSGLINTTGTPFLDSTDYATFTYSYDSKVQLDIDWKVTENHPMKTKKNEIVQLYPAQKKNLKVITNFDFENLQSHLNPFLKGLGEEQFNKLPLAAKEILNLWKGQASMQMGGKTTQETVQFVTEFDDDFNQVERKIVKVDSIPNIGFYWSSNEAPRTLELLDQLPNVKLENEKLQIALLPSLITQTDSNKLKASSKNTDYLEKTPKQLIQLSVDIDGLKGNITVENKNQETVHFHLTIEDWEVLSDPKSIKISSFW